MRYITFGDKLVMVCVILISILISLVFVFGFKYGGELYVEIVSDGKEYASYPLNNFEKIIEIDNKFGYNEIRIYNGKVWVTASDCDEQTEINESPIYKEGQMLVCLPHRLVVSIVSGKRNIDGVTY